MAYSGEKGELNIENLELPRVIGHDFKPKYHLYSEFMAGGFELDFIRYCLH